MQNLSLQDRLKVHRSTTRSTAKAPHPTEEDGDYGLQYKYAWNSKFKKASVQPGHIDLPSPALQQTTQAERALQAGRSEEAIQHYGNAIRLLQEQDTKPDPLANLCTSCSTAHLHLKQFDKAAALAEQALSLMPDWLKPYRQLALAQLGMKAWHKAEARMDMKASTSSEFSELLDQIAVEAALEDSLAGFDGRRLEVRDAGEDAWLGKEAPEDPALDLPPHLRQAPPLALHAAATSSGQCCIGPQVLAAVASDLALGLQQLGPAEDPGWRRSSFRSLRDAVKAAQDGDRITLLPGIHNGMGETLTISKRLLIQSTGAPGQARIDFRGNSPTFRLARCCVLQGLDIDQSGFAQAVMVEGRDSGDDAVNVCGSCAPVFRGCTIGGAKVGVKAYGSSRPSFVDCSIEKCGVHGLRAMDAACPSFSSCQMHDHGEDAVVAMDSAHVSLDHCSIWGSKGPGIDLSGQAQLTMHAGSMRLNAGGLWMWDMTRAALTGVKLQGGSSFAILADAHAFPSLQDCTIDGNVHATDAAWEGIWHDSNCVIEPYEPADFPPESGAFRFVPNQYTRKQ